MRYLGRSSYGWRLFLTDEGDLVRHIPPSFTPWQLAITYSPPSLERAADTFTQ